MKNAFNLLLLSLLAAVPLMSLPGADDSFKAPDSIVLKDGRVARGLIIKNTRDSVLLQEAYKEEEYPKSEIVRILDGSDEDVAYTAVNSKGDLPAWRVIVNDLRTNDSVRLMEEIPATLIDNGKFQNVPYKSFRVNGDLELNIYGDPEDPAAIELGLYGAASGNKKLRGVLRGYLAGYLTSRDEVSKLYALSFKGGTAQSGELTLEITPKDAPDAYGAWWVSVYNRKKLERARLSEADYAKLVRPVNEVIDRKGRVIVNGWSDDELDESNKLDGDADKVFLKGFYRDKDGVFRLITETRSSSPGN